MTVCTGHPHSTISKVLQRHGISRPARAAREPERRYEWPCPGDLLHMDVSLYARFERPGHAVTGDRRRSAAEKRAKLGYDYAHAIVDDHSRLGYAELLEDERASTVTAFLERALAFFAAHEIEAKPLMTDNAWGYTKNRSLRELLAKRGIHHLTTRPRRPRTNGKVERFRLSKDVRGGEGRWWPGRSRGAGQAHAYLGARRIAAQVVESGRRVTAHSKVEPAATGLRRKTELVKADPVPQAGASSSSRRTWKARLPILRATVGLATVVSRRARVAR